MPGAVPAGPASAALEQLGRNDQDLPGPPSSLGVSGMLGLEPQGLPLRGTATCPSRGGRAWPPRGDTHPIPRLLLLLPAGVGSEVG